MTTATYTIDPGNESTDVLEPGLFEILNHCDLAKAKLLDQFKTKPRIESLLCDVFIDQVQELEVALFDLLTERTLDTAIGEQLDVLGRILVQPRMELSDENYRALLKARVLANRSDGQAETLIGIVVLVQGAGVDVTLTEPDPATAFITVLTPPVFDPVVLFGVLKDAKAAGVRLVYVFILEPEDETFQFSETDVIEVDADEGFGDAFIAALGGSLAGAFAG